VALPEKWFIATDIKETEKKQSNCFKRGIRVYGVESPVKKQEQVWIRVIIDIKSLD
jgi:hypothetical protein